MKHTINIKIYYEDTDAGGVVYYANYLKYFERARTEFFESLGIKISQLAKEGIKFVVVKTEVDYINPARLGDMLEIETEIFEVGKASLSLKYKVIRKEDKKHIVSGMTKLACVNNDLKPVRIPDVIYSNLKQILETKTQSD
ncbi:MAG: YbgC/FadM family acyl-CoA thioesterase [Elusimicrobiota bacterium]|nr:YbgC/FadM family acyl-CoA thioesterase [Elusimicrobiota bacterium]